MTRAIWVNRTKFVLKQVNSEEAIQLGFFFPKIPSPRHESIYYKAGIVSLGLVFIDSNYLLPLRPLNLPKLVETVASWAAVLVDQLFEEIIHLTATYHRQVGRVSLFADLPESRALWKGLPVGLALNDPKLTGWPDTDRICPNMVQRTWIIYQRLLDDLDQVEMAWSNLKWVVGCQNHKAVQAMDNIENMRREQRRMLGRSSAFGKDGKILGQKTEQDLIQELKDSVEGKVDAHDMAVINFESEFMKDYLDQEEKIAQKEKEFLDSEMPRVSVASQEVDIAALSRRHAERHRASILQAYDGVDLVKGEDGVVYSKPKSRVSGPIVRDGDRLVRR